MMHPGMHAARPASYSNPRAHPVAVQLAPYRSEIPPAQKVPTNANTSNLGDQGEKPNPQTDTPYNAALGMVL